MEFYRGRIKFMLVQHWFSTPIFCCTIEDKDSIQKELINIYNKCSDENRFHKKPEFSSKNHSLSDVTFKSNIILESKLVKTQKQIIHNTKNYINYLNGPNSADKLKILIKESWLTKTSPGENTVPHNHGDYDISGVYYIQTNGNDGSLSFINPLSSLECTKFLPKGHGVVYKPEVGLMILFPSWLNHFVEPNDSNTERISLAFNIKLNFLTK